MSDSIIAKYKANGKLKLYLPLCDGTLHDYSGNGNDGVFNGGAKLVREGLRTAYDAGGANYVVTNSNVVLPTAFTVFCKVKPASFGASAMAFLSQGQNVNLQFFLMSMINSDGTAYFYVQGPNKYTYKQTAAGFFVPMTEYAVALVFNEASTPVLYINGIDSGLSFGTGNQVAGVGVAGVNVGRDSCGTNSFDGTVSNAGLITAALTASEIASLTAELNAIKFPSETLTISRPSLWHPTNGLVGAWDLGDCVGLVAPDSSGNGNSGTLVGGPVVEQTNIGRALSLDGVNLKYVNAGIHDLATGKKMSLVAWVNLTTIPEYAHIIGKNRLAYGWGLQGDSTAGKVRMYVGGAYTNKAVSNNRLDDGLTHLVVGTYDGTLGSANIKLYVDGELQSVTFDLTDDIITGNGDPILIGGLFGPTIVLGGRIAYVKQYNRALSASEIRRMYESGRTALYSSGWGCLCSSGDET